ncbi:unnamed protein product [Discosporangium mesarthrocarpum]
MIWPALKEKARSSGGKLRLVDHNHDLTSTSPGNSPCSPSSPFSLMHGKAPSVAAGGGAGSLGSKTQAEADGGEGPGPDGGEGPGPDGGAGPGPDGGAGPGPDGGAGPGAALPGHGLPGGEDEGEMHGVIDEHEYIEEHSQELQLFEEVRKLLVGLRSAREGLSERLVLLADLDKKTDEMCQHLFAHLDKEEESALPLIRQYFTVQEMRVLVGKIMGKRPSELMQAILSMVMKNLPQEGALAMMGYMRQAVKDTYFETWLNSGGFKWPKVEVLCLSCSVLVLTTTVTLTLTRMLRGVWSRSKSFLTSNQITPNLPPFHVPLTPLPASSFPLRFPPILSYQHQAGETGAAEENGMGKSEGAGAVVRGGSGVGRAKAALQGSSSPRRKRLFSSSLSFSQGETTTPCATGFCNRNRDGGSRCCPRLGALCCPTVEGRSKGHTLWLALGLGLGLADRRCDLCSFVGHCPVSKPLKQVEFEALVKRVAQFPDLTMDQKTELVQSLQNYMYQSQKRPRVDGGGEGIRGALPSSTSMEENHTPGIGGRDGTGDVAHGASMSYFLANPTSGGSSSRGAQSKGLGLGQGQEQGGEILVPPARHYTSTQPDIENSGGTPGRDWGSRQQQPIPLFTREELAPTYHKVVIRAAAATTGEGGEAGSSGRAAGVGKKEMVLGCPHYQRACKMRAGCCKKLFTCRLCHDQGSDHIMDRQEVKEMLCMHCGTLQPVHSECRNSGCAPSLASAKAQSDNKNAQHNMPLEASTSEGKGRRMARYYCSICHLFDDAPDKDIYHCPYCNMCRLGKGLGVDFFHCMICNACVSMEMKNHTCVSKGLESDCPICGISLFNSTSRVKGLKCGHLMHLHCYKEYIKRSDAREFWYRCPICRKSMDDMQEYFSQMDAVVASQPMPDEYSDWKSKVLCYDCEKYTEVPYHFYYLKCGGCGSYNTRAEGQVPQDGTSGSTGQHLR